MFSSTFEYCDHFDLFVQMPSHTRASQRCDIGLHYLEAYCFDREVFWSHSWVQQIFLYLTFISLIKKVALTLIIFVVLKNCKFCFTFDWVQFALKLTCFILLSISYKGLEGEDDWMRCTLNPSSGDVPLYKLHYNIQGLWWTLGSLQQGLYHTPLRL